jgi:predicted GH43/DUF377 family glycosyl hydrolase
VISQEAGLEPFPVPPPQPAKSVAAISPAEQGAGNWVGAPSAVCHGGEIYLAYRLRKPIGEGRGYAVEVARSSDGEHFTPVCVITKEQMDTESLERPALIVLPDGRWRLYLSCATYGTKHWRVELLEADNPAGFDPATRRTVLPGDDKTGVKDPVIVYRDELWHLWASIHPLADPDEADQMVTEYATSPDGIDWTWHGVALGRRSDAWDSRGVRVSSVIFTDTGVVAFYDGRASAAENYEERTGLAAGAKPGALTAVGAGPAAESAEGGGRGLRYVSWLGLGDGRERLYYELTRADGSHELRTELR